MKKLIFVVCMALGLAACGGGGGSSSDAAGPSADALKAKVAVPDPTLAAQAISVVNTTIAGDQVFRSIGALNDGGYTVAWISDNTTLFIQRYDSAGNKVGGRLPSRFPWLPFPRPAPATAMRPQPYARVRSPC